MSLFGTIARGLTSIGRIPGVGPVARSIPFVGTGLTALDVGMSIYGSGDRTPSPSMQGMGVLPPLKFSQNKMALAGINRTAPNTTIGAVQAQHAQQLGSFSGSKGRHGLSPSQAYDMLQAAGVTLGSNYWRTKVCAPPGYVMVSNPITGQRAAVPKAMAIKAGLWRAHAKPPISVRQWHALKHAKAAIKHLHKVEKAAHIITHATTRHTAQKALPFHRKGKK